jgi:hypothetical protein
MYENSEILWCHIFVKCLNFAINERKVGGLVLPRTFCSILGLNILLITLFSNVFCKDQVPYYPFKRIQRYSFLISWFNESKYSNKTIYSHNQYT